MPERDPGIRYTSVDGYLSMTWSGTDRRVKPSHDDVICVKVNAGSYYVSKIRDGYPNSAAVLTFRGVTCWELRFDDQLAVNRAERAAHTEGSDGHRRAPPGPTGGWAALAFALEQATRATVLHPTGNRPQASGCLAGPPSIRRAKNYRSTVKRSQAVRSSYWLR